VRRPACGWSQHPALVASLSPVLGGTNSGLHRTYLARDGLAKANVPKAKKMAGQQLGCAVKVWRGESGLSASEAQRKGFKGVVVVTEGIEDALSCAASAPEHRVWAVGSLAGLGALPWHPCVERYVIFADNDWASPAAQAALDAAVKRLAQMGEVSIARSPVGKDANDLLRTPTGAEKPHGAKRRQ
jgi:hypothetical protein